MGLISGPMRDKICLITGATSGIGAATAMELAGLGATTIVVGRDRHKCEKMASTISRKTGNAAVESLTADLSSRDAIRQLVREFENRHDRLDVLINNAGGVFGKRQISTDGLEMTLALNHLAPFLLTNLLLDRLYVSPSARIVVVASAAHENGTFNFEDLQGLKHYQRYTAYAQSKLANVLFTYEIARRLIGTKVTANAVDPGSVATNLGRNNSWIKTKVRNLVKRSMLTPQEGARTVIYLASSPDVEGITGRYFYLEKEAQSSPVSCDLSIAKSLWQVSEELTGEKSLL